jgi:hypothetical protein
MGIDIETARFLARHRRRGMKMGKVLTIGRQNLLTGRNELAGLCREYNIDSGSVAALWEGGVHKPYADDFLRALGADSVEAMDASDYEQAGLVHDLNKPVPQEWKEQFDLLVEGGSLEHVFNFPVAMGNCLELVKVGGSIVWVTPANNFLGHGFYQFSPELAYRVFSEANGYRVDEMVAVEYGLRSRWFSVRDPAEAGDRVKLVNGRPVLLMTRATRLAAVNPFTETPQQSDYSSIWERHAAGVARKPGAQQVLRKIKDVLIERVPRVARVLQSFQGSHWNKSMSFRNPKSFAKVDKAGN